MAEEAQPNNITNHGHNGDGASVGEPSVEPGRRIGERLEEPLVEHWRIHRKDVVAVDLERRQLVTSPCFPQLLGLRAPEQEIG